MKRLSALLCGMALGATVALAGTEAQLEAMEPAVARAIEQARDQARQEPTKPDLWGRLGGTNHAHGLLDEAVSAYRRAAALTDESFVWNYLAAVALDEMGQGSGAALEQFAHAAEQRQDYVPLWIRWGQALSRRGRYAEARDALEKALKLDPEHALAQRTLGQTLLGLDDLEGALAALRSAVALEPRDRSVHVALARAYSRLGVHGEAESASRTARRLKARGGLADPLFARHVERLGVSSRHRLTRAQQSIGRGDFDEAIEMLKELRTSLPHEADVAHLLGLALQGAGREDEAIEAWRLALSLHPTHVRAHVAWANLLRNQGRYEQALPHYQAAREVTPYDPSLLAAIGGTHERAGQLEEAIATYRLLVELEPEVELVRTRLSTLIERLERRDSDEP